MVRFKQKQIKMKNLIKFSLILLIIGGTASCLKHNLPDYPTWKDSAVEKVYVEYRYESSKEMHGEPIVTSKNMDVEQTIDTVNATVNITVTIPEADDSFTEEERSKVSQDNLWVYLDISTAAIIEPLDDTPELGDPANLNEPLNYRITAANGDERDWTIVTDSIIK